MKKQLPNFVSCLRILFSLLLLAFSPVGICFLTLYLLCGVSDMLDGLLARKLHAESALGARLDSTADLILVAVSFYKLLPLLHLPLWLLLWTAAILLVRAVSMVVAFRKYHTFAILHTYGNKAAGFSLFLFPLLFPLAGVIPMSCAAAIVASLSALEELLIHLTAPALFLNRKSLLIKEATG